METEITISVIGLTIAFLSYRRSFKPAPAAEPIEERENLKVYFLMVQKTYLQTQSLVETYIIHNNAAQDFIFENVTFGYYLQKMKSEFDRCNSNEVYKSALTLPLSKSNIDSMMDSLKVQYDSLIQIKFRMEVLLNQSQQ
jgi:hypothetical protein